MAFIHVIIPCYNVEAYLEQTVDSVLKQPFRDIDIVLVDDGSPGRTPQLCDEIAAREPRVHVIHQPNGGVSAARNAGISYILGRHADDLDNRYFAFLDADDIWMPSFFSPDIVKLLQQNYDSVAFRALICNHDFTRCIPAAPCTTGMQTGSDLLWNRLRYHFASALHSCVFFQKNHLRFPDGVQIAEDTVFQMHCCYLAERVWQDPKILYLYRKNPTSVFQTRKFGIPHFVPIIEAFIRTDDDLNGHSVPERAPHTMGKQFAHRYLHEMIKEHYEIGGTPEELDALFHTKPNFMRILAPDDVPDCDFDVFYRSLHSMYMKKRPALRLRGLILAAIRTLRKIPLINSCIESKVFSEIVTYPE